MNQEMTPNSPANPPSGPVAFTVCPRCHYPGHHPMAASWGAQGGKAKVKKGMADPKVMAKVHAALEAKRKAIREAKAKAKAEATAPPPR